MSNTVIVPLTLEDGTEIHIEATPLDKEEDVSSLEAIPFDKILHLVKGIGKAFSTGLHALNADKASIKLGLEVSLESGALTALIVKGTGKANFEINLEWSKPVPANS
jgi:hypothetical protein